MHHPLDYESVEGIGKADGGDSLFIAEHLISDEAFFDGNALSAAQLQAFLENTTYGTRSFLADFVTDDGIPFSRALHDASMEAGVNPLVMLVTLQKESSLVSKTKRPSQYKLDYALGCGCPDGRDCMTGYRGLDKQIACAAKLIHEAKVALDGGGKTVSGRRPGGYMTTSDGKTLRLANEATTILYTYTPWVLYKSGGNWLFWNIWRRYCKKVGYARGLTFPFNEGWIGGRCRSTADCYYDGAFCEIVGGVGTCTRSCLDDRICPDRDKRRWASTFCIADLGGRCVATCTGDEEASSCPDGQVCAERERNLEAWVKRDVCVAPN